ncbi:hypothetical protein FDP41_011649 [Naegleria fowleri]|uniref:Phosphatidate phosphatase APP1 catalytic domain-containing protein n=1 Tax=Naegleria fowleri TaxID=5763 RepID=A0A6A5C6X2_NAEFO|nr:uncharacterized protein FDP41_011649 [Naegleria fowleri]KAF0982244.1 hypothetical protein FDP41_011649 [Naegleria fowleri]
MLFSYSFYLSYVVPTVVIHSEAIDSDADGVIDEIRYDDLFINSISFSNDTFYDPLHLDVFRTFTLLKQNNTKFHLPVFGYMYYNTDLEFYYHQLFRYKDVSDDHRYLSEFHHLLHLTYKLYLRMLFKIIQLIFNIEYTIFKEVEHFFLRFSAPKKLKISLSIPMLNHSLVLHSDEYGYFYHEVVMDAPNYKELVCDRNMDWIEYRVQILDHVKTGNILSNCDTFKRDDDTNDAPLYSIISDIDDSIKITNVTGGIAAMMKSTFNPFIAVPWMNESYIKFKDTYHNANFHYVSSSPYVLYNKLETFILKNNFPIGSFHLRVSHLENRSFFTMLRSSKVSKPVTIHEIMKNYSRRKFLLVGDSAENDAEIYAHFYHQYPRNVDRILIRCASPTLEACIQKVQKTMALYQVPPHVMDSFATDSSDILEKIIKQQQNARN